jgi:cytochrome c peroxidase
MKRITSTSWIAALLLAGLAAGAVWAMDALPRTPPEPADNPTTPAKVELGKQLFFDPRLSSTGTVSCNSCHNVMEAGEDDRAVSVGVGGKTGSRSAPTVWNSAYLSVLFWDGRAASLEEQAKGPIVNPSEMGMSDHAVVVSRLREIPGYQEAFRGAFPGTADPVTIDNVARAIAAYERTLVTPNSAYDRFKRGEASALDSQQKRGMQLAEEIGCTACHSGPVFAGPLNPGDGFYMKFPLKEDAPAVKQYGLAEDAGRFAHTGLEPDRGMWRVPMWRNVAITAPYMHNGRVPTLDEAVRVMAVTQLGRELTPQETADLTAFLGALTGEFPRQTMPRLPETPGRTVVR